MRKQAIVTSAFLMGFVFLLSGNAWAERERPRDHGERQHNRDRSHRQDFHDRGDRQPDRAARPDHDRQWRGRDGHHNRPGRDWAPERRHQVRKHQDRRWHHRRKNEGPRHHWRGFGRHHAWQPVVEKHVYHLYGQAESEPAPAGQFEIATRINDPSGVLFSFGIRGMD